MAIQGLFMIEEEFKKATRKRQTEIVNKTMMGKAGTSMMEFNPAAPVCMGIREKFEKK